VKYPILYRTLTALQIQKSRQLAVKLRILNLNLRVKGSKIRLRLNFPSRNRLEVGKQQNELSKDTRRQMLGRQSSQDTITKKGKRKGTRKEGIAADLWCCQYSFTELERTLYVAFDSVGLRTIRRFADRSKRWLMAYINGLTAEQREYAEKLYKSHRRAGRDVFV